jgi:hypothetical protein
MRKILRGAVVLLIAFAMLFSTVALADTQTKQDQITLTSGESSGEGAGARGTVVWDNGMNYDNLGASQEDTNYPLTAEIADDFHFEEDTEVCDVHWVGGYWNDDVNYNQVHWPWKITFYYDDGSGERPGNLYLGPFTFDNTEYTETLLEDNPPPDESVYYEFSVDLPENYIFPACHKFWIVIQGVGFFPPQSGFGMHQDPITLHEAVFRCELLGFPDWTDSIEAFGASYDACFQLTTKQQCEPGIDVEKEVWDEKNGVWVDADTESEALDIDICTNARFRITIKNIGNCPLFNLVVKDKMHDSLEFISSDPEGEWWYEEPFYYIEWYFPGPFNPGDAIVIYVTAHVSGEECSIDFNYVSVEAHCEHGTVVRDDDWCYVHCYKPSKEFSSPILQFIESHFPNLFKLVEKMLKLLGL